MKVAVAQISMEFGQAARNCEKLCVRVAQASARGADLLVFPEASLTGMFHDRPSADEVIALAEPDRSVHVARIRDAAARHRIQVVVGLYRRGAASGLLRNTALILGRDGRTIGEYHKTHMPQVGAMSEREVVQPGDKLPVFSTPFGRIGLMICFDGMFPETPRVLASRGAETICWLLAGFGRGADVNIFSSAHARQNWVNVVTASAIAHPKDPHRLEANSQIVDYQGRRLAHAGGRRQRIITAELSPPPPVPEYHALMHRRPELYRELDRPRRPARRRTTAESPRGAAGGS